MLVVALLVIEVYIIKNLKANLLINSNLLKL